MFERIIGDARRAAATELRLIATGGAASLAATATLGVLCAAAFVFVMDRYILPDGSLHSLCLPDGYEYLAHRHPRAVCYLFHEPRRAARASFAARAARQSLVAHPFVIATGVQIAQAIGIKRVAALAAVAGTAVAPVSKPASRSRREAPGEP